MASGQHLGSVSAGCPEAWRGALPRPARLVPFARRPSTGRRCRYRSFFLLRSSLEFEVLLVVGACGSEGLSNGEPPLAFVPRPIPSCGPPVFHGGVSHPPAF